MNISFPQTRDEYDKMGCIGINDCPFCSISSVSDRIVWEWSYWYIINNLFPYSGTEKHLMLIPYRHMKFSQDLNSDELLELWVIHQFLASFFGSDDYFSCTRESISNRSVEHLHMHFIPGRLKWKFLRKMLELQWFPIHEDLIIPDSWK